MNEGSERLYKMVQIKGGKRIEKFSTTDVNRAIKFHKWYVARYREGLLLEILEKKSVYNIKNKKIDFSYE